MQLTIRSTTDGESLDYQITYQPADASTGTEHELLVRGGSADNLVEYEFEVDGQIELGEFANADEGDEYAEWVSDDGTRAGGFVGGYKDTFRFVGDIVSWQAEGGDYTVRIDGDVVDPSTWPEPADTGTETITGSTSGEQVHQIDGTLVNFEQTGGGSDWVLEADGEPIAFGGPQPKVGEGFAYATKQQIRSFVECYVDRATTPEEDFVKQDELGSYVQEAEMDAAIQDAITNLGGGLTEEQVRTMIAEAFDNASVSIGYSGIEIAHDGGSGGE